VNLPSIPKPGAMISPDSIVAIEAEVSRALATIDDIDILQEWRSRAAALEAYLRGKDLNGPMLGAQRRVEARIGQLLGDAEVGNPSITHARVIGEIPRQDRSRFRQLARALDVDLDECHWRQSRRALIDYLQEKYPMPRRIPTVVQVDGIVKKPRAERIKEITKRAEQGMRAEQISSEIGVRADYVRQVAKDEGIAIPDDVIGGTRRLNAKRILTETVNGVDAYVSGLSMLDGVDLPDLPSSERGDLMQALSRSINGLKKLRTKMEKFYAGHDASAA
jgi:hypothetical protein